MVLIGRSSKPATMLGALIAFMAFVMAGDATAQGGPTNMGPIRSRAGL